MHNKCEACGSTLCNHTYEEVQEILREYELYTLKEEVKRRDREEYIRNWGD